MQKELSDSVKFKVLKKSVGVNEEPVVFAVSAFNSVILEEAAKKSAAGLLYQQSLTLIITREEATRMPTVPLSLKAIVELSDCDATYTWGTEDIPVDITITPRLEKVQFDMSCNSLRPLFGA